MAQIPPRKTQAPAYRNILTVKHKYHCITDDKDLDILLELLINANEICFAPITTSNNAHTTKILGISFSIKHHVAFYVPFKIINKGNIKKAFKNIFSDANKIWVTDNSKYNALVLQMHGMPIQGELYCTILSNYVLHPGEVHKMYALSKTYLNYEPIPISNLIGIKAAVKSIDKVELYDIAQYACEYADITLQLKDKLFATIEKRELNTVLEIENTLTRVIMNMEATGVRIDVSALNKLDKFIDSRIKSSIKKIHKIAGIKFNIDAPSELGNVLFNVLNLNENTRLTPTGNYSTAEDVLDNIKDTHIIVPEILEYKSLRHIQKHYTKIFPTILHAKTNTLHTSFNQTTATGRLSSSEPALQNIPIRTKYGRMVRECFIPSPGNIFLSADYSQIELRVVAAIANDTRLIQMFNTGIDAHSATAASVYKIPINEVTENLRQNAKRINFGIIYGQSGYGLSNNIGVKRQEANLLIERYLNEFTGIKNYMYTQVEFAKTYGFVQTLLGRKRQIKNMHSPNKILRDAAYREAINTPIQGTAADLIKLAMINIHKQFILNKFKSKMILQVHDELLFDVRPEEKEAVVQCVTHCMINALQLPNNMRIEVRTSFGSNWLDAHV